MSSLSKDTVKLFSNRFFLLKKNIDKKCITALRSRRGLRGRVALAPEPQKYTDCTSKWKTKQNKNETGSAILAVIKGAVLLMHSLLMKREGNI